MNISINKNVLENMLINSLSFLDKKDSSQITSHVLLNAHDGLLTLKATDFEIGLSMETKNVNIALPGVATANGKKLFDIIKILKDDEVILKVESDFLHIKQNRSKFKLTASITRGIHHVLAVVQNGRLRWYAWNMVLGLAFVVVVVMWEVLG